MGVHCQILIQKPKEGVHKGGQFVDGVIKYAIDKPTEYDNIWISLIGEGKCWWSHASSGSHSSSHHKYTGKEAYVSQQINVLQRPGETVTMPAGSYEYPFQFRLPDDAPPSFKNASCSITYHVKIKFEKPTFFSIASKFEKVLIVYGLVKPTIFGPVSFGLKKSLFKLLSVIEETIYLRAEIEKAILTPGENAKITFYVNNNTDTVIKSIKVNLICEMTYKSDCNRTHIIRKNIKGCSNQMPGVSQNAVTQLSGTFNIRPDLYSITTNIINKAYKFIVTVVLPVPHKNATVEIPVLIGEVEGSEQTLQELALDDNEDNCQPPTTCLKSRITF